MSAAASSRKHRLFDRIQRTSNWFESRFTALGQIIVLAFVVALIFSLDPRQSFAYKFVAVLLAVLTVATINTWVQRPKLRLQRTLPQFFTVAAVGEYFIDIENRGKRATVNISVKDLLHNPNFATSTPPVRPATRDYHWFERAIGFLPWLEKRRIALGARTNGSALYDIPASATHRIPLSMMPLRRGVIHFSDVEIRQSETLGVMRSVSRYPLVDKVIVLPQRVALPNISWRSKRQFHQGGFSLAASVGDSQEFIGLRDYRPGDPLRQIHWRSFAKLGKPTIREYQDEYFDHHGLFLDTTIDSGQNDLFEAAVQCAASFVDSPRPTDSLLDLVMVEDKTWRLTAGRGASDKNRLLEHLAVIEPKLTPPDPAKNDALSGALLNCGTVIYITCCWDFRTRRMVDLLKQQGAIVLAIQITEALSDNSERYQVRAQHLSTDLPKVLASHAGTG